MTKHHARVVWSRNARDRREHTVELGDQSLVGSAAPEFGGDGSKADPEELFVASLSACHMLWFLDLARRDRITVAAYEDEPVGTMDGTRFTAVVLRPSVQFAGEVPFEATVGRLHERAHGACFIANSVTCSVVVEPR